MNAPITITATRAVWLSQYHTPDELLGLLQAEKPELAVDILSIWGSPEIEKFGDYMRVGEADVTVRLLPRDKQTALAIASLNKKLQELRAAYVQKQQQILEQINNLQALTNEVPA